MKKTFLLACLLGLTWPLFAQKPPMKWGKIPSEQLEMQVYEADSSATAVVLCDYGELEFSAPSGTVEYLFDHHKRIKILEKKGIEDYGDITIRQWGEDEVSGIKAQVILPNGEEIKLKKKDIYKEKVRDGLVEFKFSFPKLVEGAIIEYKYQLKSGYIGSLQPWFFQAMVPTLWSEYRLSIPEWYDYVQINRGRAMDEVVTDQANGSMMIPGYTEKAFGGGSRVEQRGFQRVEVKINKTQYIQKDVPALKQEPFITTMNDYLAYIEFQLNFIAYPRQGIKQILPSWSKVAKNLSEATYFGQQYTKKKYIKDILKETDPIMKGIESNEEKVATLYEFVASNMDWNGKERKFITDDLETAFEKKTGSSADLNLMLLALLKHYGVESYPVLVSTRDHGQAIELYAIVRQFDHVITLAKFGEQFIAIDVDDPTRPLGYPRINSLNSFGWLVDAANPQWIQLPSPGGKMVSSGNLKLDAEGTMSGTMDYKFEGYPAISVMSKMKDDEKGHFLQEDLKEMYPDMKYADVEFKRSDAASIVAKSNCEIPYVAQVIDDMIYLTPTIEPDYEENPFKLQERSYPVDIPYPNSNQIIVNIEIPEGYVVDELPEPTRMSLEKKGASFNYRVSKVNDQMIQIISKLTINQLKFSPQEYQALRGFFDLVVEKQSEQVVLRKKS
jgi:hypothetical protein